MVIVAAEGETEHVACAVHAARCETVPGRLIVCTRFGAVARLAYRTAAVAIAHAGRELIEPPTKRIARPLVVRTLVGERTCRADIALLAGLDDPVATN